MFSRSAASTRDVKKKVLQNCGTVLLAVVFFDQKNPEIHSAFGKKKIEELT